MWILLGNNIIFFILKIIKIFFALKAFASVESMSDRICIQSSGAQKFFFSAEDLLSCCTSCGSCAGGYMMTALDFYIKEGLVSGGDLNSNEVINLFIYLICNK